MEVANLVSPENVSEQGCAIKELCDLELAFVGGGTGDISLG